MNEFILQKLNKIRMEVLKITIKCLKTIIKSITVERANVNGDAQRASMQLVKTIPGYYIKRNEKFSLQRNNNTFLIFELVYFISFYGTKRFFGYI